MAADEHTGNGPKTDQSQQDPLILLNLPPSPSCSLEGKHRFTCRCRTEIPNGPAYLRAIPHLATLTSIAAKAGSQD